MKKQFLIVTLPVANVHKEPVEKSSECVYDELQETQVLYNEILLYREETDEWYHVEATEQKKMTLRGDWQGYPGWIRKTSAIFIDRRPAFNAIIRHTQAVILEDPEEKAKPVLTVSIGTRFAIEDKGNDDYYQTIFVDGQQGWVKKDAVAISTPVKEAGSLRTHIVGTAKLFLGTPYLWGGRSACGAQQGEGTAGGRGACPQDFNPKLTTDVGIACGVDCSGLTNLVYRVNMLDIPRDAHDQWLAAKEIAPDQREPADLIFISAERKYDKITHVMLHIDGEEFIEAPETGRLVHTNTFKKKFGLTLQDIVKQNFIVDQKKISFGSVLNTLEKE
jgi:gamma-D-glutamyl-L-lysine dipeptidyl-peptidase